MSSKDAKLFHCPDKARHENDVVGCGAVFEAEPDDEGTVDCPHCGIWFMPEEEASGFDKITYLWPEYEARPYRHLWEVINSATGVRVVPERLGLLDSEDAARKIAAHLSKGIWYKP